MDDSIPAMFIFTKSSQRYYFFYLSAIFLTKFYRKLCPIKNYLMGVFGKECHSYFSVRATFFFLLTCRISHASSICSYLHKTII